MRKSQAWLNPLRRPPLRALVIFEAAARLGSFHAAAQQLRLTASAISRQIIGLEELLGVSLFARVGRGIELTSHGSRYLAHVQQVLLLLDRATAEIVHSAGSECVAIHTPPSIASRWLMPLLSEFLSSNPGVEAKVLAETGRASFSWDHIDLALTYAAPRSNNSVPLLDEVIQPMCSPRLLAERPISSAADVLRHVLIKTSGNAITWDHWFAEKRIPPDMAHTRIHIDPSGIAIEAAVKDFGVVLESDVLAREELASGKLVAPLGGIIRPAVYQLAWAPGRAVKPAAALLRDWLLDRACPEFCVRGIT